MLLMMDLVTLLPHMVSVVASSREQADSAMAVQGGSAAYASTSSNSHAWSCLSMITMLPGGQD
jgi:hypothetical protein